MNTKQILKPAEKYLNDCFKNISIKSIEKIEIDKKDGEIFFKGDVNLLNYAFKDIDEVEIKGNKIIIPEDDISVFKEFITQINVEIEDFNIFASQRKGININF